MDPALLSNDLVVALTPFLPTLLKLGESTATEMGKELGAEAGRWASELWQRLARPMSAKPAARPPRTLPATRTTRTPAPPCGCSSASSCPRTRPSPATWTGCCKHGPATRASVQVTAQGERSVAIGGDAVHSRISTGDQHDR